MSDDHETALDHRAARPQPPRAASWERGGLVLALAVALLLGACNLSAPSLWHDELVHVFVARSILATGQALLPSGHPHGSGPLYSAVLAGFMAILGDGEAAVRIPSVLAGVANVVLLWLILRPLLGRATALVAAWGLALSPWCVAWSREARFYALQQTLYLLVIWAAWRFLNRPEPKRVAAYALTAAVAYVCAVFTALHSVIFLGPIGGYAFLRGAFDRSFRRRGLVVCIVIAAIGTLTVMGYRMFLPSGDSLAVFKEAGLGARPTNLARAVYYLAWLRTNLSTGFLVLALLGFGLMAAREKDRGLFVFLAFWAPLFVLSFLITYKWPRFMYFAFPFYVAAFSYGLVQLIRFLPTARRSWPRRIAAVIVLLFLARLSVSAVYLTGDSIRVAAGANTTLARRHPQWRAPCRYVREHLDERTAVVGTTYLPVLYYVGRIDTWYPSRYMPAEVWETGSEGLADQPELEAFVALHPKGYFLAESWRFNDKVYPQLVPDVAWVQRHMKFIPEASSPDVAVYAWGMDDHPEGADL